MPPRVALLSLPLALLLGGCLERAAATVEDARRPVQAVRVVLAPAVDTRTYAGVVRAKREADVGFRAAGRIVERLVDAGDLVVAGQPLARLDPADLILAERSAEADFAAAQATETQAAAAAARSTILLREGHVAAAADDLAQAATRTATQRARAARIALGLAQNRLDYATLRAPADGIVTAVLADPGTVMAEGTPVLRLADPTPEVEVAIPEAALAALDTADATVSLWARPDAVLPVRLRERAAQADPRLRTYTARFTLPDPPAWVAMGMTATLTLRRAEATPLAALPAAALTDRGQGPMVWLVDATTGHLAAAPVQVAALRQDQVLVGGLSPGQLVVALGVQKLDPAAIVRVADIAPPAR